MNTPIKPLITVALLFLINHSICFGQQDTVFTNNQKIACSVKEIGPDAVKYTYPGEEVMYSVFKNTVQKIVFKSGRVQTFTDATTYKVIQSVMDYDKVSITAFESEIRGLTKLGDVSSKAKGTTSYSSEERVKERAYRKLKIQAAILGANIIFLTSQHTEGNKYGYYSSSATETNLTGFAYSNVILDFEKFKKTIASKTRFVAIQKYELGASDSDLSQDDINRAFTIANITNENGIIMIQGVLTEEENEKSFQLVSFSESSFNIAYKHKGTAYNFLIAF